MLLVFGGTTEGRRCAAALASGGRPFLYSTRTPVDMPAFLGMRVRHGALTPAALVALCRAEDVRGIVHAAHPFADQLHATVQAAAETLALPVWRFERARPPRSVDPLVHYVPSLTAAVEALRTLDQAPLLALSGVQTIPVLRPFWQTHTTYFRILDRPESWAVVDEAGFPHAGIIAGPPDMDARVIGDIVRARAIRVMLTKESGVPGGQPAKIAASRATGVPLLIVERPVLPASFRLVADEAALMAAIAAAAP